MLTGHSGGYTENPLRISRRAYQLTGSTERFDGENSVGRVQQFSSHHVRHFHTFLHRYVLIKYDVLEYRIVFNGHPDYTDNRFQKRHLTGNPVQNTSVFCTVRFTGVFNRVSEIRLSKCGNQIHTVRPYGIQPLLKIICINGISEVRFIDVLQLPLHNYHRIILFLMLREQVSECL